MAFSVEDFPDLVRLLEQHPEWRAELRRLLVPEALLDLPAAVRELAEQVQALARTVGELAAAQRTTDQRVGELAETQRRMADELADLAAAQRRTEQQLAELVAVQQRMAGELAELAAAQRRTEERVGELAAAQRRTEEQLTELVAAQWRTDGRLERLERHVADLRGSDLERRYREHAGGYFGRLLRRVRVVGIEEMDDLLEAGLADGTLDADGAHDVRLADLIVRGRRPGEEEETYVIVEVSVGLGPDDVERAERRANLLGRLRPALAVVAGAGMTPEAESQAAARGVWRILDGRTVAPNEQ